MEDRKGETGRQTDRETAREKKDKETGTQTGRRRETERETDRQTDREEYRQTVGQVTVSPQTSVGPSPYSRDPSFSSGAPGSPGAIGPGSEDPSSSVDSVIVVIETAPAPGSAATAAIFFRCA